MFLTLFARTPAIYKRGTLSNRHNRQSRAGELARSLTPGRTPPVVRRRHADRARINVVGFLVVRHFIDRHPLMLSASNRGLVINARTPGIRITEAIQPVIASAPPHYASTESYMQVEVLIKIIPTYAGNTESPVDDDVLVGDHPRVCGEHLFHLQGDGLLIWDHPRVCGGTRAGCRSAPFAGDQRMRGNTIHQ